MDEANPNYARNLAFLGSDLPTARHKGIRCLKTQIGTHSESKLIVFSTNYVLTFPKLHSLISAFHLLCGLSETLVIYASIYYEDFECLLAASMTFL